MGVYGWLVRVPATELAAMRMKPATVGEYLEQEFDPDKDEVMHLDMTWHVIHFLLTGTPAEAPGILGKTIFGGDTVGEDRGNGPARCLTPGEVREVAAALSTISPEELVSRYDCAKLHAEDVYLFHGHDPTHPPRKLGLTDRLLGRKVPKRRSEYEDITGEQWDEQLRQEIRERYADLVSFYANTATGGYGVLAMID